VVVCKYFGDVERNEKAQKFAAHLNWTTHSTGLAWLEAEGGFWVIPTPKYDQDLQTRSHLNLEKKKSQEGRKKKAP